MTQLDLIAETTRRCSKCRVVKPLEEFHRKLKERLGRRYTCKICEHAYDKRKRDERTAEHRAAIASGTLPDGAWTCKTCGESKLLDDFYVNLGRRLGRHIQCKKCSGAAQARRRIKNNDAMRAKEKKRRAENPAYYYAISRRWRAKNPDKVRVLQRRHLLKRYGLTFETYDVLLAAQNGLCAICKGTEIYGRGDEHGFVVDHCHGRGIVRGLLCNKCNQGIGLLDDNPARLRAAADYIERHSK